MKIICGKCLRTTRITTNPIWLSPNGNMALAEKWMFWMCYIFANTFFIFRDYSSSGIGSD